MSKVEDRIVAMKFDNSAFENKIKQTMKSIEDLNKKLDNAEKTFGLKGLADSVKGFTLDNISSALDNISNKFSVLGAVGFAVIQKLTNAAIDFGKKLVNLALDPILQGGRNRALNLEQARFMFQGLGMDVESAMASALEAVKGTAYGLDAAAKVAAQFGGAGVEAGQEMTAALRGISGLAAMTGRSYEEIGMVMTGIAGVGKLTSQDLIQFGTRGINVAAQMAKTMGKTEKEVREMVSKGSIDFRTFAAMMDDTFGEHATRANEIYTGSVSNLRAALARIGASFIAPKLESLRRIFNALTPVVDAVHKALKPVIKIFERFQIAKADALVSLLENLDLSKLPTAMRKVAMGFVNIGDIISNVVTPIKDAFKNIFPETNVNLIGRVADIFETLTRAMILSRNSMQNLREIFEGVFQTARYLFTALLKIITPIKDAFKDIFPRDQAVFISTIGRALSNFAHSLIISDQTAENLRRTFRGLFSVIVIVWEVIKQLVNFIVDLTSKISIGETNISVFTARLGDALVKLKEFLVDGEGIKRFFENIPGAIKAGIESVKEFIQGLDFSTGDKFVESLNKIKDAIVKGLSKIRIPDGLLDGLKSIFGGIDLDPQMSNSLAGGFDRLGNILSKVWEVIKKVGNGFKWFADKVKDAISQIDVNIKSLGEMFREIGPALSDALMSPEFDKMLETVQTLFLGLGAGGLFKLGDSGLDINLDLTGGFLKTLSEGFKGIDGVVDGLKGNLEQLTGVLSAMETKLKAEALQKIAISIGILAAALLVLSMVDPARLGSALAATAVGFGQLVGTMALLDKVTASGAGPRLAILATSLGILAGALLLFSLAIKVFSTMSWEELAKGMSTVTAIMVGFSIMAKVLQGNTGGLIRAGIAMIPLAIGLNLIAISMKIFATMSWEEIGKGLTSVAGALTAIAIGMRLMPKTLPVTAVGLVAVGVALNLIAASMLIFATMSWEEIGKGLTSIAGSMIAIAIAMRMMPKTMPATAVGLVAVGVALNLIAASMLIFSSMSWEDIGKGMVGIAGGMIIIAAAMHLMPKTLPVTAAGLVMVGGALILIATAMKIFGSLSIDEMVKGLIALAGALLIIAVATNAMSGAILGAVAIGIVAVSLGVLAKTLKEFAKLSLKDLAKGLIAMAASLAVIAGVAVLLQPAVVSMILLGTAMLALGAGFALIGFGAGMLATAFHVIATAGKEGVDTIMYAIDGLIERIPAFVEVFVIGLMEIGRHILEAAPGLIAKLGEVIGALIQLVIDNIPKMAELFKTLIGTLLDTMLEMQPKIIETGITMILNLLKGIRDNIGEVVKVAGQIIEEFIIGIGIAALSLADTAFVVIINFINGLADVIRNRRPELMAAGRNLMSAIFEGITEIWAKVKTWFGNLVTLVKGAIPSMTNRLKDIGKTILDGLWNGIKDVWNSVKLWFSGLGGRIRDSIFQPFNMLYNVGKNIVTGLRNGIRDAWHLVTNYINDQVNRLPGFVKKALGISSPSKVFHELGYFTMMGFAEGLGDTAEIDRAAKDLLDSAVSTVSQALQEAYRQIDQMEDFNPTITPVLDLSQIQSEAGKLNKILDPSALSTPSAFDQARLISMGVDNRSTENVDPIVQQITKEIKFEQINHSPEALSTNDIYRQTKNQISMAKRELELV